MGYFDNNTWVRFLLDLIFFVVFWFVSFTILWVLFIEWELFGGGLWIGQESGMILCCLLAYLISFRLSFIKNLKLKISTFFETNKYTSKFVMFMNKKENVWIIAVILIILGFALERAGAGRYD
tara:strand:+ start:87 stop:455 length:369 start_codon:yes stop_codon:yes gene_type:complete